MHLRERWTTDQPSQKQGGPSVCPKEGKLDPCNLSSQSHAGTLVWLAFGDLPVPGFGNCRIHSLIHSFIHPSIQRLLILLPISSFGLGTNSTHGHFQSPEKRPNLRPMDTASVCILCVDGVPVSRMCSRAVTVSTWTGGSTSHRDPLFPLVGFKRDWNPLTHTHPSPPKL